MSRYLPLRSTRLILWPLASTASQNLADGWAPASTIRLPVMSGSNCRRTVSTSGNSGIGPTYRPVRASARRIGPWIRLPVWSR